jgi:hypothetical protein
LDGKHVVFGQVIYGIDVINKIADLPCFREKPELPVNIIDCGEIGDTKYFIRNDPFSKENMEKIKEANKFSRLFFEDENNYKEKKKKEEEAKKEVEDEGDKLVQLLEKEKKEYIESNLLKEKDDKNLTPTQQEFLKKMREKINKNIEQNFDLISKDKTNLMNQANSEKTKRIIKKKFKLKRKKHRKKNLHDPTRTNEEQTKVEKDEEDYNEWLLNQTVQDQQRKKKKKKQMFGWNVFNEDALYDAHKKRLKDMVTEKDLIPEEMQKLKTIRTVLGDQKEVQAQGEEIRKKLVANNILTTVTDKDKERIAQMNMQVQHILGSKGNEDEQRKTRLVKMLEKQKETRDKFKRRRGIDPDSKMTYINERNRAYNEKLYRHFGGYVKGIESKLERGG